MKFWNSVPATAGLVERVDYEMLERHVFSKQYFDRDGFIVAEKESRIVGFAHVGFPPSESLDVVDYSSAIVSLLRTDQSSDAPSIAAGLLQKAVDFCRSRGATTVHSYTSFPFAPFYLGLYGGSRVPGVMTSDRATTESFTSFGFKPHEQTVIMELDPAARVGTMCRQQMAVRRSFNINASNDPLEQSWWESCTLGRAASRERFTVVEKRTHEPVGSVSYWDMLPRANRYGGPARGLYNLNIREDLRRSGIATYLVAESLKHLSKSQVAVVEAQACESDLASLALFEKLGFQRKATGQLLRLELTSSE